MDILNWLKDEIKNLASEENQNFGKLREYMYLYERIKAFETTSVEQVMSDIGHYDNIARPIPVPRVNDIGNMLDIFKELSYNFNRPRINEIE